MIWSKDRCKRSAFVALAATLILLATVPVSSAAADYDVNKVETEPENPVTGKAIDLTVHIENKGDQRLKFTKNTRIRLFVDGEKRQDIDFLVKPNWTNPPEYLNIDGGETGTWKLVTQEEVKGTRDVEVQIEGPYVYGGEVKDARVRWEGEITFSNPVVRGLDSWITHLDDGIKPSVVIADGKAYTGQGYVKVLKDGETLYSKPKEVRGANAFVQRIPYDEFFQGNGTYTVEAGFERVGVRQTAEITRAGVTTLGGSNETDASEEPSTVATETEQPTEQSTVKPRPTSTGIQQGRDTPGFTFPLAIAAIVLLYLAIKRQRP